MKPSRSRTLASLIAVWAALGACAQPQGATAASRAASGAKAAPASGPTAHAYFAGGCFWSAEHAFEGVKGVRSVVSGFTGGAERNPTYHQVSAGGTGHYEAVDITYVPSQVSYEQLLDIFWHNIDPTEPNGQICDFGKQYRTAIFTRDAAQAKAARESMRRIAASGVLESSIATAILPAGPFWPAEEHHQDFARKNPGHYSRYRVGCGRDRRLDQIWGKDARRGSPKH
jgi:peptide-methionine (S)-S-oxide reductase